MSKTKQAARAAIHVGSPAKSFTAAEGNEPERRGWDEDTYRLKNQDSNNHYDLSRNHLNFEINSKGEIVPLGSNPIPLHERLKQRLDQLEFKPYKGKDDTLGNSDNSPNCTVGIIISGDHDLLTRLAYGDQQVDFSLQRSNAKVHLEQGIKDWAMDTYNWACDRWGAENIIGFDVHLDETTPHIQIQMIPVAKAKTRGRTSFQYVSKKEPSIVLKQKEWKKLSEKERENYVKTETERKEKDCVSYAKVWGADKYEVGRTYYQMHTDYHNKVGRKYGLERGDNLAMLPEEEQRERVHKNKDVLEAERQAKKAIEKSTNELATKEAYLSAINVKEEELKAPALNTDDMINKAYKAIKAELDKSIPVMGQKEWREERKRAIKAILTTLQDELIKAKADQKQEILKLGRALYLEAMKKADEIIKQNKQLLEANAKLKAQNAQLKEKISTIDESAIKKLRMEKDEKRDKLQSIVNNAQSHINRANDMASRERKRADDAEDFLREVFAVPEIKDFWNMLQQNKREFWNQVEQWIESAKSAIYDFAYNRKSLFSDESANVIGNGIICYAFKKGLNAMDDTQRMTATQQMLSEISWKGTTEFMSDLACTRTKQLCDEMSGFISSTMLEGFILAAGGRDPALTGGGGSGESMIRWDGKKKKSSWER